MKKNQCSIEPKTLLDQIEVDNIFKKHLKNKFVRGNVELSMKQAITGKFISGKCKLHTNLTVDEIVKRCINSLME